MKIFGVRNDEVRKNKGEERQDVYADMVKMVKSWNFGAIFLGKNEELWGKCCNFALVKTYM